jgi:hypothetical protein
MTTIQLYNAQQAVVALQGVYKTYLKPILLAGHEVCLTFEHDLRTVEQNAQQWPYLDAFSKQIPCDVNGEMVMISPGDWKDILTSAFLHEVPRVAVGYDGAPPVMLGQRTRKFTRKEWPVWMEFLRCAATQKGVKVRLSKRLTEEMGLS